MTDNSTAVVNISLRDWFAGLAMQAILSHNAEFVVNRDLLISCSYKVADDMLKEKEKP